MENSMKVSSKIKNRIVMCMCVCVCVVNHFSCVWPCHPMNCSPPAPMSMVFSRQDYWNGLLCLPPAELPDPGIEPVDCQQILYLLSHRDFLYNIVCLLLNKDGEKKTKLWVINGCLLDYKNKWNCFICLKWLWRLLEVHAFASSLDFMQCIYFRYFWNNSYSQSHVLRYST